MSSLARQALEIQVSSKESERHLSGSDEVVSDQRSGLSSDVVEALTVLKEAVRIISGHKNLLYMQKYLSNTESVEYYSITNNITNLGNIVIL